MIYFTDEIIGCRVIKENKIFGRIVGWEYDENEYLYLHIFTQDGRIVREERCYDFSLLIHSDDIKMLEKKLKNKFNRIQIIKEKTQISREELIDLQE